jgi:glycosyltransferase involved in cell wall biosynthesis
MLFVVTNMKRKKILLCTTVPETFNFILRYQPAYLNQFYEVFIVTSPSEGANLIEDREGVTLIPVSMQRGINPFFDFYSICCMMLVMIRIRPDIVHSYTPKAGLISMLAGCLCRVPIRVHTFTGLIFPTMQGFKKRLLIGIDRLICACSTDIVPEGMGVKSDLINFNITNKPLQVIGHGNIAGVDTTYFCSNALGVEAAAETLRLELGIDKGEFVFCFVGRLNKDKGLSELMLAFSALSSSAHLLLVGVADKTAPISSDVLCAIDLHPRVHALGFMNDIRPALRASNVLVLPSYREGFPNSVLQAASMEIPVIASDINGCNEVIEPGLNGWLVPPRNSLALRDAMSEAMQTPFEMLLSMGQQARSRIEQRFEQRHHWMRMLQFYQVLLESRNEIKYGK